MPEKGTGRAGSTMSVLGGAGEVARRRRHESWEGEEIYAEKGSTIIMSQVTRREEKRSEERKGESVPEASC